MNPHSKYSHRPFRLYCLPFAGGNSYSYRHFEAHLDASIEMITLELPGHGCKIQQPLLKDAQLAVDIIFDEISTTLDEKPYAFYGHSMGALLTYLLTQKIIDAEHPKHPKYDYPQHIFISGRKAPSIQTTEVLRHKLAKEDFIDYLKKLGGLPKELLASDELLAFFEPILRADFELIETYRYKKNSNPFDIPITVLYGTEDQSVQYNQLLAWEQESCFPIQFESFSGGHFFIYEHLLRLGHILSKGLLDHVE